MLLKGSILLLLVAMSGSVLAQKDTLITVQRDTLKAAKVIKQRDGIPLSSTQAAQQLSQKELENSLSLNVADALKGFSGVQIRDYGGIGGMKTIDVRSLGSKHTAIFYDGLSINDAQSGEIDLSKFSIDHLQSITLYQNNHQDIVQPAKAFASASVLFLQTRRPDFNDGKNSKIRVKLNSGSFGLINPSLGMQQKLGSTSSLSVNTEWLKANGEYDFHYKNKALLDTVIRRKNTDIETFKVEGILQGLFADSSLWRFNAYAYFSERGLPGPAVNNKFYTQDRQWDKDIFLQGHWDKKVSAFYQLKVNGKFTSNSLRYLDPTSTNSAGKLENTYDQDEYYLSTVNAFQWSPTFKVALAMDYLYNTLDANLPQFVYPIRHSGLINLAVDYQGDSWRIQGNLLTSLVDEQVREGNSAKSKTAYSPSFSFSWKPFNASDFSIRTAYKSIFRMPSFNDSYYTLIGSTRLLPEYAKEYNLGFTWQKEFSGRLNALRFKADGYHNRIKDRITAIPKSFRWTMLNIGSVEITGLELSVQGNLDVSSQVTADFSVNATFQQALDKTKGGNYYGQDIPYAPAQSSSASASLNYRSWVIGSSVLYSGTKYSSRSNIPFNGMDAWFLQDFSISYGFNLKQSELKLRAEVNNVYNADYVILSNYPMPGRNFRLGIHFTL